MSNNQTTPASSPIPADDRSRSATIVHADKNRQEAIIAASGLDWVLVRPSVLTDKPGTRSSRALEDLSGFHVGTIARC